MRNYEGCLEGTLAAPLHSGLPWTVYDLLSGRIVKKLTNHKACVRDVSWHPFEEKIVSSSVRLQGFGGQGPVHVWDLDLGGAASPDSCHLCSAVGREPASVAVPPG